MATPEQIDAQLADLRSRGVLPPAAASPQGTLAGAPPAVQQYAADMVSGSAPPAAPPPMAHDAPAGAPTPQGGLARYADSLHAAPRQAISTQVNGEIPEVAAAQAQQAQMQQAAPAGPPMPRYIPPHFDDRNVPIKPHTRQEILGTFDTIAKAEALEARARADQASVVAERSAAEGQRAQRSLAGQMQQEDQRRQVMRQQLGNLQQVVDAAKGGQIDENQVMNAKGTFGKLAAGIGIALGAGVQAAKGGSNPALDIINAEISRNLQVQKQNLELRNLNVVQQDNLLARYRELFGDERLAEMAYENVARQVAIQQIQAEAAKRQVPEIQANAMATIAKIQQQQLQTQGEFEKMAFVRGQMIGGGTGTPAKPAMMIRMPDGSVRLAPNDVVYNKATEKAGWVSNIQANINKALEIRKNASNADLLNPWSSVSKRLKSLQAETEQIVTVRRGQGAMSKGDQEVADQALGVWDSVWSSNDDVMRDARDRAGQQLEREVDALGAERVNTGYRYDQHGRLAPDFEYAGQADRPAMLTMPKGARRIGGGR